MIPFINIDFPSGHKYQVPSFVVLNNITQYLISCDNPEDAAKEEAAQRCSSAYAMTDWLKSNMNWSDVAPFARLVDFQAPDMGELWGQAKTATSDTALPVVSLDNPDGSILSYPLEAVIANLAAAQQIASTLLVESADDSSGDYMLALSVVQGPKDVVNGYVAVTQNFTDYLRNQANERAAQADAAEGTQLPTTN